MQSPPRPLQFAGVDPCKAGWVVTLARARPRRGGPTLTRIFTAPEFADVIAATADCSLVAVHIPIGLTEGPDRQCDLLAREILGRPRAGSVFSPPVRQCLNIDDYPTASRECFAHTFRALNMQTFHVIKKIAQVDSLITPAAQSRIVEVHPELAFYALNRSKPVNPGKTSPRGLALRRKLLDRVLPDIEKHLPRTSVRKLTLHDIYDSLAAAWTACRALHGKAAHIPEKPQRDPKHLKMQLLLPQP